MNRREMLHQAGLGLALGLPFWARGWTLAADKPKKRVLMYTRSEGFQHDVVQRKGDKLSLAENIVTAMGAKQGFEVTCEKDGRVFESREFPRFDGFLFETQGNLTKEQSVDGQPPMSPRGKQALLDAVKSGKGFAGCHCASDTFHSPSHYKNAFQNSEPDQVDPYIAMLGGEFIRHGEQQNARMLVVDPKFPGLAGRQDFDLKEEWYSLKNFAPDLHVILVQETKGMRNFDYQRPNFPATWARVHGKGRVFFTSMGHRADVWENAIFQALLLGGLSWTLGFVEADLPPNLDKVAPQARELPKEEKK